LTKISVTLNGDTSGTWLTTNGAGMVILFSMGYGTNFLGTANTWQSGFYGAPTGTVSPITTNGATFYITGVQLEQNTSATPFERRMYGQELQLCQRYYAKLGASSSYTGYGAGEARSTTAANIYMTYPVPMRAAPTFSQSGTVLSAGGADRTVSSIGAFYAGNTSCLIQIATSGLTAGWGVGLYSNNNTSAYIDFSIEL
jgi:hypothetical protein